MNNNIINKVEWTYIKIKNDFQEFAFSNNFIATAAAISIGSTTKDFIENVLSKVIIPILYMLGKLIFNSKVYHLFKEYHNVINPVAEFMWDILKWLIIVVVTFIILEYFFNRKFLGLRTLISDKDKKNFIKAKQNVNEPIILINDKDINNVKKNYSKSINYEKISPLLNDVSPFLVL
jgi:large-conductance mechanosensitive channel